MSKAHRERLEKAGWKVGDAAEFLDLTDVEAALVEAKLALGDAVRALRQRSHLSQQDLAKRMGSSQSRVAKVENHDPGGVVRPPTQGGVRRPPCCPARVQEVDCEVVRRHTSRGCRVVPCGQIWHRRLGVQIRGPLTPID